MEIENSDNEILGYDVNNEFLPLPMSNIFLFSKIDQNLQNNIDNNNNNILTKIVVNTLKTTYHTFYYFIFNRTISSNSSLISNK